MAGTFNSILYSLWNNLLLKNLGLGTIKFCIGFRPAFIPNHPQNPLAKRYFRLNGAVNIPSKECLPARITAAMHRNDVDGKPANPSASTAWACAGCKPSGGSKS